jgi:serine phosphatase RsbU (regulator of sigma subunit)
MPIREKRTGLHLEEATRTATTSVFLHSPRYEIVGVTIPYDGSAESGDVVGACCVADGALAWVIDVEGKGPSAAPAANALHRVAYDHGFHGITNPATVLSALHAACVAHETRAAATIIQVNDNAVTIGVAGVQSPIIINSDNGNVTSVDAGGMTLGFPFDPSFTLASIDFPPTSILLAGSDGFYEDHTGELIDVSKFARILKGHRELSMASNLLGVLNEVRKHSARQSDDVSLMMLRRGELMSPTAAAVVSAKPRIPGSYSLKPPEHHFTMTAAEYCGVLS